MFVIAALALGSLKVILKCLLSSFSVFSRLSGFICPFHFFWEVYGILGGQVAPIPLNQFPPTAVHASFHVDDSMSKNSVGSALPTMS